MAPSPASITRLPRGISAQRRILWGGGFLASFPRIFFPPHDVLRHELSALATWQHLYVATPPQLKKFNLHFFSKVAWKSTPSTNQLKFKLFKLGWCRTSFSNLATNIVGSSPPCANHPAKRNLGFQPTSWPNQVKSGSVARIRHLLKAQEARARQDFVKNLDASENGVASHACLLWLYFFGLCPGPYLLKSKIYSCRVDC